MQQSWPRSFEQYFLIDNWSPLIGEKAFSRTKPDFNPRSHSIALNGTPPGGGGTFWDEGADFVGAIRLGNRFSWLDGWSSFPENGTSIGLWAWIWG